MNLRTRIAVATAMAVAGAIAVVGTFAYVQARATLRGELDKTLEAQAEEVRFRVHIDAFSGGPFVVPDPGAGTTRSVVQLVDYTGQTQPAEGQALTLPVTPAILAVAAGDSPARFDDIDIEGKQFRMLTVPTTTRSIALQVAMPLEQIQTPLSALARIIFFVILLGVAMAAVLGKVIAAAITKPVEQLTETAERVAETRDLSERIWAANPDELGRLADAFNKMLIALDESVTAQRQLVADASHELRTPIASLRTNIEVLARGFKEAPEDLRAILSDLVSQSESLSRLVADLLDLARDPDPSAQHETVAFDELVEAAVQTTQAAFPEARFEVSAQPCAVIGEPNRLERAARNLIENAAKWNPSEAPPINISLSSGGLLTVTDHGPGVAPEHREHIFERFWRTPEARNTRGSGLGLAIVRRIARDHKGTVFVEDSEGGGARFSFVVPAASPPVT